MYNVIKDSETQKIGACPRGDKLRSLHRSCICQLRTKDNVPEATGYAESILEISEMVLEVVFLQFSVVRRQVSMVQEVVGQVVADVAEYAPGEDLNGRKPVIRKDEVGQVVEWRC